MGIRIVVGVFANQGSYIRRSLCILFVCIGSLNIYAVSYCTIGYSRFSCDVACGIGTFLTFSVRARPGSLPSATGKQA